MSTCATKWVYRDLYHGITLEKPFFRWPMNHPHDRIGVSGFDVSESECLGVPEVTRCPTTSN